jgi:UDP-N-acetyl-D-glucosamine dehydrogenase
MTATLHPGESLKQMILDRTAPVGVIGMGYVGLPLAMAIAKAGFAVTGFDIDETKADSLNAGLSYMCCKAMWRQGSFRQRQIV